MHDDSSLYGPAAAATLSKLSAVLQQHVEHIAERLFRSLLRLPKSRRIFEVLSDDELEHIKRGQIRYLLKLGEPSLSLHEHEAMAEHIGRIHASIGLDRDDLVKIPGLLWTSVRHFVDPVEQSEGLELLGRRFTRDLALQTAVYQKLQSARQNILLQLTELAWKAQTYTDLIVQIVDVLGRYDEVEGCSVGRPDTEGIFRYESVGGPKMAHYLSELEKSAHIAITADSVGPTGNGPTGRAWRSSNVERSANITTDPCMAPWREPALRSGFRSSVAIPLLQPEHSPRAILTLYSAYPAAFSAADRVAFISILQMLLGFALARIEGLEGKTRTVSHASRQFLAGLLQRGELLMHYQPLIDLKSGRVTKVEALARLRDGDRLITPDQFLPAFSSDDLFELYRQGIEKVLSQRNVWLQRGCDLAISLNLPPTALGDVRYLNATQHALKVFSCPPGKLTLEVLEYDAFPLGIDALEELSRYKQLGILLAEDDLGAGHSSLTRLREIPFDDVKIDRHTSRIGTDAPRGVLLFIFQLIQLGHALGKQVTVEGIEDLDMLEAVLILGADFAQGYGVGRPMAADHIPSWLDTQPLLPDGQQPTTSYGVLARDIVRSR